MQQSDWTGQDRTGQDRADRTGHDTTGHDRTRSNQHRQSETDRNRLNSFFSSIQSLIFLLVAVRLDVDECRLSKSLCDVNADCKNTLGSYRCLCKPGFTGDGKKCNGMMVYMSSNTIIELL